MLTWGPGPLCVDRARSVWNVLTLWFTGQQVDKARQGLLRGESPTLFGMSPGQLCVNPAKARTNMYGLSPLAVDQAKCPACVSNKPTLAVCVVRAQGPGPRPTLCGMGPGPLFADQARAH